MSEPEPQQHFQIGVPPELENGAYANFLGIWHTAYEFTLDFGVTQPPQGDEDSDAVTVPVSVVSRVKMPVAVIFSVLQAINQNMTRYEESYGPIRRPQAQTEESFDG